MTELRIRVVGTPAPQGSKRHVGNGVMVEMSKRVRPWRQDVAAAAEQVVRHEEWHPPRSVQIEVTFWFRRPKHHYGTGRNAHQLRERAPEYHAQTPDLDKLVRATLDALKTAGAITDDCTVVRIAADKRWASAEQATGAQIRVIEFPPIQQGEHT